MSADADLLYLLQYAETTARLAGEYARRAVGAAHAIRHKTTRQDLVTEVDTALEEQIVTRLRAAFPAIGVYGEEGSRVEGESGLTWQIDPIDGTTNFTHGMSPWAVSIGLRDAGGPLLGVIFDPMRDEMFGAMRGAGAALNGAPIHVSGTADLRDALLSTGFPSDRHTARDNNVPAFAAFSRRAGSVRRLGAATLDLAYLAAGRLDGYWEMRAHAWDVCAGLVLVAEAGGRVTDYAGGPPGERVYAGEHLVASNGYVHDEMLAVLADLYELSGDGGFRLRDAYAPSGLP
jgi:myo-inositol-1(or 4)-monophosphatase